MDRLGFVDFNSSFYTSFRLQVGWFTVSVKKWLAHCPWIVLQYRRQTFAAVYSGEVGRSAVNSRYNNGPRTLPWGRLRIVLCTRLQHLRGSVYYINRILG
jgi:hypothetical protein